MTDRLFSLYRRRNLKGEGHILALFLLTVIPDKIPSGDKLILFLNFGRNDIKLKDQMKIVD
ncbi:hypothetical protein REG_1340 [Candidatus Regiella insecticola LSR1]|uniref:Uncharacterized protein n=1 Tax=Candidatus Regiella insecticola LSR1 TaxID=663321 RepID=E0WTI1_9ENTR|nr:hypothetical protein REG_1340 [Candidatus Regiella insecticola LSR1]